MMCHTLNKESAGNALQLLADVCSIWEVKSLLTQDSASEIKVQYIYVSCTYSSLNTNL